MKRTEHHARRSTWQRSLLSIAVSAAAFSLPMTAQAIQFDFADGEVSGSFDTTLGYGSMWRVTGQDKTNLAPIHGGTKPNANYDNGDVSYKRGEQVSSLFKMTNDLDLNYRNFGAFVRVSSWYDSAIQSKSFDNKHPNGRVNERLIKDRLGHDYEILDAYVRGKFQIAGKSTDVRVGKQVVSWGESTFIPNGINVINPVDVAKLRSPGSELKEAFLPVNMLWVSQEISDNLSIEAFNQFEHKTVRLEPNGSYFSTNDFISPGGRYIDIVGADSNPTSTGNPALDAGLGMLTGTAGIPQLQRRADREASDSNQYGLAVRLLVPELNNTEFGLYYINYHSRVPYVSGRTGNNNLVPTLTGMGVPLATAATISRLQGARYNADYPEDIKLFGLSFSTPGPLGIALQGEYSYRPNMPLQIAATDLLNALVTMNTNCGGAGLTCATGQGALAADTDYTGYKRVKYHQAQLTGTKSFGPQLGAGQVVGVAEAGYTYMDLPDSLHGNPLAFNGTGLDHLVGVPTGPGRTGAATKESYGYRLVARADYSNAIGAINLSPRVAFSHDLRGVSPTFNQGVQAVTVGVGASYQSSWQADIAYTNYFGGETYISNSGTRKTTNNPLSDRDFIAATVSYSF